MSLVPKFREALNYIENELPNSFVVEEPPGHTVCVALLNVALDHAQGICVLLANEKRVYPSAMALLRVQFETYIRAMWFGYCATHKEIKYFLKNDAIKRDDGKKTCLQLLIDEVEMGAKLPNLFTKVKKNNYRLFNSFTHGGVYQLAYYMKDNVISHQYTSDDVNQIVRFSNMFACMTFASLLDAMKVDNGDAVAEELMKMITPWAS